MCGINRFEHEHFFITLKLTSFLGAGQPYNHINYKIINKHMLKCYLCAKRQLLINRDYFKHENVINFQWN